jgi:acetyl/propionyl-CoA carboxylase alpha subunit
VEHPVTEMVTGLDIVREQITIAFGDGLSIDQEDLKLRGWAIECRINAEDPFRGFLPSPGRVSDVDLPSGPGVRVDTALRKGQVVSTAYDPLLVKVITHGRDRVQTIGRMRRALDEMIIRGVRINVPLHKVILSDEAFLAGNLSTSFIQERRVEESLARIREREEGPRQELVAALAAAVAASDGAILWRMGIFETLKAMTPVWSLAGREALHRWRLTYGHEVHRRP